MALEGSLKDFGLADIFQLIYVQKKTGSLTMKNASTEARVLFENGLVVSADTAQLEGLNKIGEVLLRSGKISEDQLKEALLTQRRTKEKIGIILVEMGAIAKDDLIKALGLHVKEAVFSLFQWKEGRYSFEPADISYQRDYWLPINTEFLIMEGVRRIDEWPYIEKKIPSLCLIFEKVKGNEDKVKIAKSEEDSLDEMFGDPKKEDGIHISQEEMTVFNLVNGQQDVRHLIETSNLGEFETCKALSNLLTAELIAQSAISETEGVHSQPPVKAHFRWPILTLRHFISAAFIISCISLFGFASNRFIATARQAGEMAEIYHNLKTSNLINQVSYTLISVYYRNKTLPDSLKSMNQNGSVPSGLETALKDGEVLYEPDDNGGLFRLSIQNQEN
ncbi:MAG TPA: DUF4388 domain-containing protein [Candidatus Gracilibacteria bacterium]|nr:DUF4388 domain-containing protein [Candidatus Gracilibacteria bacterium]